MNDPMVALVSFFQGGYAGDAVGFRLQSLSGLEGIRANGGRLSLLHLIVTVSRTTSCGALVCCTAILVWQSRGAGFETRLKQQFSSN